MSVFKSNIFLKSFISYVALLVVPIFLIGGVSYYKAANVAEKQLLKINLMALEKVKDYYDKSFRDIRRISILVNELPWLRDILLMDEKLDYERINEGDFAGICLQLRNYRFSNDFFKDIAVVLRYGNVVFDCDTVYSVESYFDGKYSYKSNAFNGINGFNWNKETTMLISNCKLSYYNAPQ